MPFDKVKDIMFDLNDYAIVPESATMLEAIYALDEAQKKLPSDRQPHRAILVEDSRGRIVGKLGHLAFLKGLEPKYQKIGDLGELSQTGLSQEFISTLMNDLSLWKDNLSAYVDRAKTTKVSEVMRPVTESIDENASLNEALHKILMYQSLSILVTRNELVVGILRLSDLFTVITTVIKKKAKEQPGSTQGQ
jgi:hypothetical protein